MKINNKRKNIKKIKRLYHYVKFDCKKLTLIVILNKLYANDPKCFNDPFDSKIQFTFQRCTDDDFRFVYRDLISNKHPELRPDEVKRMVEKIINSGAHRTPENQEELRNRTIENFQPEISKCGMISLSEERDDILMWSHYSDDHKGLCLEFDKELLDKHFLCRKVKYVQRYPRHIEFFRRFVKVNETAGKSDYVANEATEDLALFILCTKSKHWAYEHEWRIIIPWQRIALQKGDRFISYPEGMLAGIICGCNMDESQQTIIEDMIAKRSVKPILFKSRTNRNKFKLDIRKLDIQISK